MCLCVCVCVFWITVPVEDRTCSARVLLHDSHMKIPPVKSNWFASRYRVGLSFVGLHFLHHVSSFLLFCLALDDFGAYGACSYAQSSAALGARQDVEGSESTSQCHKPTIGGL